MTHLSLPPLTTYDLRKKLTKRTRYVRSMIVANQNEFMSIVQSPMLWNVYLDYHNHPKVRHVMACHRILDTACALDSTVRND